MQVVEAEREVLVWERRVQLEKEMQVGAPRVVMKACMAARCEGVGASAGAASKLVAFGPRAE